MTWGLENGMKSHIPKINLLSVTGALTLFLLPWVDVSCNGRDLASQTGVQACRGTASLAAGLEALESEEVDEHGKKVDLEEMVDERVDPAINLWVALIATGIALVLAFREFRGRLGAVKAAHFAVVAAAALLLQWVAGFPVERAFKEDQQGNVAPDIEVPEWANAANAVLQYKVDVSVWFGLTVLLLLIPAAITAYQALDAQQVSPGDPEGGDAATALSESEE